MNTSLRLKLDNLTETSYSIMGQCESTLEGSETLMNETNVDKTVIINNIQCLDEGDMEGKHREIILKALVYCSTHNQMKAEDVADKLDSEGMRAIVTMPADEFHGNIESKWSKREAIKWSAWKCKSHRYLILMLHYEPQDDQIKCLSEGNMVADEKAVVLDALRYCSAHNTMDYIAISARLNQSGMKCVVIQDQKGFAFNGMGDMTWSNWKSAKYGTFTTIKLQYRPKDSTEVVCSNQGNMSNNDRNIVAETLRGCLADKKMKAQDVCTRLNERNLKSIVMVNNEHGFYYNPKSDKMTWAEWNVPAFGTYSIVIMKNANIQPIQPIKIPPIQPIPPSIIQPIQPIDMEPMNQLLNDLIQMQNTSNQKNDS